MGLAITAMPAQRTRGVRRTPPSTETPNIRVKLGGLVTVKQLLSVPKNPCSSAIMRSDMKLCNNLIAMFRKLATGPVTAPVIVATTTLVTTPAAALDANTSDATLASSHFAALRNTRHDRHALTPTASKGRFWESACADFTQTAKHSQENVHAATPRRRALPLTAAHAGSQHLPGAFAS